MDDDKEYYSEIIAFGLTREECISIMRSNDTITQSFKIAQNKFLERLNPVSRFIVKKLGGLK